MNIVNQYKISKDKNGNKTVKISRKGSRGFSIQTNGNLPKTHQDGVGAWTHDEIAAYVINYGTKAQKSFF